MDIKQLPAMISLLDDSDEEVVSIVENQILLEGPSIIPLLEEAWFQLSEGPVSGKLAEIISRIQQQDLKHSFELLWNRPPISLLKAWMCLSRIQTPQLDESEVRQWVNGLKMDVWAQFGAGRDPMQQVATLNDVLFRQHGYRGNSDHYHAIENSLIHETLKRKMGNPISLSMLYVIIGQSLGLPVFGINLPQHFIVAYCQMKQSPLYDGIYEQDAIRTDEVEKVLFYLNPFSRGQMFNKESLNAFLKVVKVTPQDGFFLPCSEQDIIKRVLRNMHHAYGEIQQSHKQEQVRDLMRIAGMEDEWPLA